jgi:flavin reductase (DIM6/NTAB) family NADH-FMN oxidoreductase RutF
MGHFGSGVTVVTASAAGGPVGFTASSVASLSLEPLLVMVAVGGDGESLSAIRSAGSFAVNILGREQQEVATRFASEPRDTRFDHLDLEQAVTGAPLLSDALGWLDCMLHEEFLAGDHVVVVGRVAACSAREGEPLIYFRGAFGGWRS